MKKFILIIILIFALATPASAMEFTAPTVPSDAAQIVPEEPQSFGEGLTELLKAAVALIQPELASAARICLAVVGAVMLVSLVNNLPGGNEKIINLTGTVVLGLLLLGPSSNLIQLGAETVQNLSEYGKLLLPVMTAALSAEGGITASAALYTGTALFDSILGAIVANLVVPLLYAFLALSVAAGAIGEDILKKLRDLVKWLITWGLKLVLYAFTGYIGITGVASGATDAAALKAAKMTISGVVPVVGSILSDASEAVLVSAGVMKNAAGIYGLLAILGLWISPFLRIGIQYLLLKMTGAICAVFGSKQMSGLVQDVSAAMGLLLAMTGTMCLLLLISTVCFMKGVG